MRLMDVWSDVLALPQRNCVRRTVLYKDFSRAQNIAPIENPMSTLNMALPSRILYDCNPQRPPIKMLFWLIPYGYILLKGKKDS